MAKILPSLKEFYLRFSLVEKLLGLLGITVLMAAFAWRFELDVTRTVAITLVVSVVVHLVIRFSSWTSTVLIYVLHVLLLPVSAIGYSLTLGGASSITYTSNMAILLAGTTFLGVLYHFKLRGKKSWFSLLTMFLILDFGGLLAIGLVGVKAGATVGLTLAIIYALTLFIPWKKLYKSKKTETVDNHGLPFYNAEKWQSVLDNSDTPWKVAEKRKYNSRLLLDKNAFAVVGLTDSKNIKFDESRMRYRHKYLEAFFAEFAGITKRISLDKKVDYSSIVKVILVDDHPILPEFGYIGISLQSKIKSDNVDDIIYLSNLKGLHNINLNVSTSDQVIDRLSGGKRKFYQRSIR